MLIWLFCSSGHSGIAAMAAIVFILFTITGFIRYEECGKPEFLSDFMEFCCSICKVEEEEDDEPHN